MPKCNRSKPSLPLLLTIFLSLTAYSPARAEPPATRPAYPTNETQQQRNNRLKWWRESRFGMFIHFGPVALKGEEISWSRANTNPACPNKGPIPAYEYDNLYKQFNPTDFDAKRWVQIAQSAG